MGTVSLSNAMKQHAYTPFGDFFSEFHWYQKRGIAPDVSKNELKKLWKEAPVVLLEPHHFDSFRNFSPYREKLKGDTERRIRKLMEISTSEDRDEVFDTKWEISRRKNPEKYILNLAELIWRKSGYDPVNVVDVNGKVQFVTGGRTRAAIAKALGVPVLTRIVCVEHRGKMSARARKLMKAPR